MDNYYYLISSLPYLKFDNEMPISVEMFHYECEKWLSEISMEALRRIDINAVNTGDSDIESVKIWAGFNNKLKQDIADIRRARKNLYKDKKDSEFIEIFDGDNPLLMEKKMESIRWNFIEQYELWYNFDINSLALYTLKLQILKRISSFDNKEGQKVFKELTELKEDLIKI